MIIHQRWREILKQTQAYTEREIRELARNKEQMEDLLFALNLPMEVNAENLVLRDARREGELVADEPEQLLNMVITDDYYNFFSFMGIILSFKNN